MQLSQADPEGNSIPKEFFPEIIIIIYSYQNDPKLIIDAFTQNSKNDNEYARMYSYS